MHAVQQLPGGVSVACCRIWRKFGIGEPVRKRIPPIARAEKLLYKEATRTRMRTWNEEAVDPAVCCRRCMHSPGPGCPGEDASQEAPQETSSPQDNPVKHSAERAAALGRDWKEQGTAARPCLIFIVALEGERAPVTRNRCAARRGGSGTSKAGSRSAETASGRRSASQDRQT